MTFTLTVPGTDTVLSEMSGELVAGSESFGVVSEGIWNLVRPERCSRLDRFAADYAAVRTAESRAMTPDEVRALPTVRPDHPLAGAWQQRAESYRRFKEAITSANLGKMVDIGAGCGWLAADLARDGWQAAAVDVTVDGGDGLVAALSHGADLLLVRAEMEALPFSSDSVDLAVFNASLHYAGNVRSALCEAARVVRSGGLLAVLDTPVFADPKAGRLMVSEFAEHAQKSLGLPAADQEGPGFATDEDLVGWNFTQVDDIGPLRRRIHQLQGARKAGRETARRPLLITTIGDHP